MKTPQTDELKRLKQAAMTGTSTRHIQDMTGLDTNGLNEAAAHLQQLEGKTPPLLNWAEYAQQQRAIYRQEAKTRRLNKTHTK